MRKRLLMCLLLCLAMTPGLAEDTQVIKDLNENHIELMWDDRFAWYTRHAGGEWLLSGLQDCSEDVWYVDAWCGLYEWSTGQFIVGNTAVPLMGGPADDALFDMLQAPDRTGWAVVNLPGSAAPLYAEADENSTVQGSFFTGTPVRLLEQAEGWHRVCIGAQDALTGWMRSDSLAFGAEIAGVSAEFPSFSLPEKTWEHMPPDGPYIAIGEKADQLIVLVELERLMEVTPLSPAVQRLPVQGWVLDMARFTLHGTEVLLVLAEDGDARRLWVCETDIQGAEIIRQTLPLPGDAALAVDAASEPHGLTLTWNGGAAQAVFDRRPDGEWLLSALVCREEGVSLNTSVAFCGVMTGAGRPVPCAFSGLEESLFRTDLEGLPARAARQDPGSWAVVATFLTEVYADKTAAQAGEAYAFRLWQGTPLQILRVEGALCQVALGDPRCGGLTGWVYTARLAVGDAVAQAALLPDLCVMPGTVITGDLLELPVSPEYIWPVGETADGSQAIILLPDGTVGTCPSACIQHGNG